jgi:hypothetical protein
LRPRLDPAMGEVVLCARVARQLVAWRYRQHKGMAVHPSYHASFVARILPPDYSGMMRFALHSLAVYLDLGMPSSKWLDNVLEASHFGHSFRRCFFFEYKANRGPYPRVTNRGVQTSIGSPLTHKQRAMLNE